MKRAVSRISATAAIMAAGFGLTAGVASAETPVYLLPGVDLGAILGPTTNLPAEALAPVFSVLTFLAG